MVWVSGGAPSGAGTLANTSASELANVSSAGTSAVAAMLSRWKACAYSPMRSGSSRSGSRETNSTRGRVDSGSASHCFCACASRSEEHTSELQSLMRISYAVFCLKKKKKIHLHKYQQLTYK